MQLTKNYKINTAYKKLKCPLDWEFLITYQDNELEINSTE